MRIPMLAVMLASGHFYLNDGFGKNCLQNDCDIYKLYYFLFGKICKVCVTWTSHTLHTAKVRT